MEDVAEIIHTDDGWSTSVNKWGRTAGITSKEGEEIRDWSASTVSEIRVLNRSCIVDVKKPVYEWFVCTNTFRRLLTSINCKGWESKISLQNIYPATQLLGYSQKKCEVLNIPIRFSLILLPDSIKFNADGIAKARDLHVIVPYFDALKQYKRIISCSLTFF